MLLINQSKTKGPRMLTKSTLTSWAQLPGAGPQMNIDTRPMSAQPIRARPIRARPSRGWPTRVLISARPRRDRPTGARPIKAQECP